MQNLRRFEAQLIDWRRQLHTSPELSNHEFETTKKLKAWLSEYGIASASWGLKTGLMAEIGSGHPIIALRADIDALPIFEEVEQDFTSKHQGVMHACGHDIHSSTILGAAILLKQHEAELHGTVRIIFQPAEESYTGAYEVLDAGVLDGVAAIFGFHNIPELPVGTFGTRAGAFYANVDRFNIKIQGKGGHAGRPHETKDPIVASAQLVQAVQTITSRVVDNLDTCVVSITQIHGGSTWNVLPESVHLEGTIRTHSKAVRAQVGEHLSQIVQGVALTHGVTATLEIDHGPAALINTPKWAEFSEKVAKEAGYQIEALPLYLIGEDFAAYLEQVPGVFVSIGSNSAYGLHHPKYQPDEALILPAAQYFVRLAQQALDHLKQQQP